MFKRSQINRARIESDEGFTITETGRNNLLYSEGSRSVSISSEPFVDSFPMMVNREMVDFPVFMINGDIEKWDSGEPVDATGRNTILENIRRAYQSEGATIAWRIGDRTYIDGKSTFPGDW